MRACACIYMYLCISKHLCACKYLRACIYFMYVWHTHVYTHSMKCSHCRTTISLPRSLCAQQQHLAALVTRWSQPREGQTTAHPNRGSKVCFTIPGGCDVSSASCASSGRHLLQVGRRRGAVSKWANRHTDKSPCCESMWLQCLMLKSAGIAGLCGLFWSLGVATMPCMQQALAGRHAVGHRRKRGIWEYRSTRW
jgi:hypothetical protein